MFWYMSTGTFFLLWPALLSPGVGLSHAQFCYSTGHPCSLYVWCPYNRSRLHLAPVSPGHNVPAEAAYVIKGTLILSAL